MNKYAKILYRLLLTCNSVSLYFYIYIIKNHIHIFQRFNIITSHVILFLIILFSSYICIKSFGFLSDDMIGGGIKEVELADSTYLPVYLGYFFVALSVNDRITLCGVGIIILIFTFCSQSLYFNPLFKVFGYRFYFITKDNGMKLFVVSKQMIKDTQGIQFEKLKRINDYTFFDRGK